MPQRRQPHRSVSALVVVVALLSAAAPHNPAFGYSVPPASTQTGPRIQHDGLNCVLAGQHLVLQALVEPIDELTTVKAYFRANLYNQFFYIEMIRNGDRYEGILPKPTEEITGIHYYLEAVDTSFNSVRTAEFTPEVVTSQASCRDDNPTPAVYADGPGAIAVGTTGTGSTFPAGFLPEGIIPAVGTLARTGGGGSGLLIGGVAAAGAAAGVGILVSGGDGEEPTTSNPGDGGGPPTTTAATTSVPPATTSVPMSQVMACFSTSPNPPRIPVGGSIRFDASCTEPARELIATYMWEFNDGRSGREGRVVNRTYNTPGVFGAVVTVTTLDGATDTAEMDVIVDEDLPPPPGPGGGGRIVRITKSGPGTASIGNAFNYNISITNTGSTPATGITMTDPIPAGLALGPVTFSPEVAGCGGGAVVTCTIATLAPGATGTITINVTPTSGGSITNTANLSVTSPPESASNRHRTSVSLTAPDGAPTRITTRFRSTLELPPGDGTTQTQLTFNEARTVVTDNSGPSSHDVPGRTGDNVVEGFVTRNPAAAGVWRFDFRGAPGFEAGSIRVETGTVVAAGSHEVVFRVAPGARRVKFHYRLRAASP